MYMYAYDGTYVSHVLVYIRTGHASILPITMYLVCLKRNLTGIEIPLLLSSASDVQIWLLSRVFNVDQCGRSE